MGRIPKCYSPPPISIPCLLLLMQHPGFPFQYLSSFIPSPLASPLSNCYKPAMHGIPFLSFCVGITPTSGLFCDVQTTALHLTSSEMRSLYSVSANITENLQMMSTSKGQRVFFSSPLLPPKIKLSHKGHKWRPAYFPLSCF